MQLDYDAAVEYLTRNPGETREAWMHPRKHVAGRLFLYVDAGRRTRPDGKPCGCLTMIRSGSCCGWTDEITAAILADDRLPKISVSYETWSLEPFAAWQTYLDSAIRGVDPTGVEFCPIVLDLARKAGAWLPEEKPKPELPAVVLDAMNWKLVFPRREAVLT